MRSHFEPILFRDLGCPLLDVALRDLDHVRARFTDKVMMMRERTEAIARLRRIVAKHIHGAFFRKRAHRAIDGRKPDATSASTQPIVKLLRCKGLATPKQIDDLGSLLGVTHRSPLGAQPSRAYGG